MAVKSKTDARSRRHARLRKKIVGTEARPRLVVTRSARHVFVQLVDDSKGFTVASASTLEADLRTFDGDKTAKARKVGELVAERAKAAGIETVVFDRGGNRYAGRVAAIAPAPSFDDREGAFADHVVIPATNAWVQPPDLDPDLGAVFDPLGNATHTALQWPVVGEDVVVTGAGPIGVMATAIVRHAGARRIAVTDLSDERLALARAAGADIVVNVARGGSLAQAQEELGMVEGFDIALEMSGSPAAVEDVLANMNHGGRVALLGLPTDRYAIDWGKVITHMITLRGIYGREMFETWYLMGSMLASSPVLRSAVSSVITGRYPAEEWQQAFDETRSGHGGKVVLDWS